MKKPTVPANLTSKNLRLRRTAYHEAGHAVVALGRGVSFRFVTIAPNPKENSLGHVTTRLAGDIWELSPTQERRMLDYAVMSLAGGRAEARFMRLRGAKRVQNHVGASKDRYDVWTLLGQLYRDDREAQLMEAVVSHRAVTAVRCYWHDIELVAKALLKRRTLRRLEIHELLRNNPPGAPRS